LKEKSNDKKDKTSKEEDKDEDRDIFRFVFITLNPTTLIFNVILDISKNKDFNNYIIDLSVIFLLILLLHDDYSSYIHSTFLSSLVILVTFITSNISRNK
jgi:hypothetical protein